jgi:hypothetical protein
MSKHSPKIDAVEKRIESLTQANMAELEAKLLARGYDLEELDRDNPYTAGLKPIGEDSLSPVELTTHPSLEKDVKREVYRQLYSYLLVAHEDAARWVFYREHHLDLYDGVRVGDWIRDNARRLGGIDHAIDYLRQLVE